MRRLLAGSRWTAEPWHGSWAVSGPTGQRHHAADLDALFGLVRVPLQLMTGEPTLATTPAPAGWHLQAGLVWVAAARAAGLVGAVVLPGADDEALRLRWDDDGHIAVDRTGSGQISLETPHADLALASLLRVTTG
ncbi:MAG: hypothetical protein QOG60_757 [Frankiaceae bacterium]|nr:hypothetical protein [Frankiaceae bacterium]